MCSTSDTTTTPRGRLAPKRSSCNVSDSFDSSVYSQVTPWERKSPMYEHAVSFPSPYPFAVASDASSDIVFTLLCVSRSSLRGLDGPKFAERPT